MSDNLSGIKQIVKEIIKLNEIEIKEISRLISNVIQFNIKDEDYISYLFDRMLSLTFVDEKDIHVLYYRLIDYTNTFNSNLGNDYEQIYVDQFNEEDMPKKLDLL